MNKLQSGNTVLGILLGMLVGITLTSAMAWFIFKTSPYTQKEQVAARDLQLPTDVVEELFKRQTRTGLDAIQVINGYRVRTNRNHEIFVQPVTPAGAPLQPEVQVRVKHTASAGGGDKQRFDFYEILGNQHYANPQEIRPPSGASPKLVVENQGPAKIAIYAPNQTAKITIYDAPPAAPRPVPPRPTPPQMISSAVPATTQHGAMPRQPLATSQVIAPARPFVSQRGVPNKPFAPKPADTPPNKVVYLEVDFFPNFNDAAKLQEKLLAKGMSVQLKEEKVLGKHAGYKVFSGPYLDAKSTGDAKAKLKKMGLNPTGQ